MKDPQRQREIDLLGQERFEQLERHRERENEMESRKRRVAEMLQRVRETKITERVGLKYANQSLQDAARSTKFFKKPRRQFQMRILPELKEEFDIRREGRDYTVGKERVDAMDWELWCLHGYPMIKV